MSITTNNLQSMLSSVSTTAAGLDRRGSQGNEVPSQNITIRRVYIGRDNQVHVSNSGFATSNWLGRMLYGVKQVGMEALQSAITAAAGDEVAKKATASFLDFDAVTSKYLNESIRDAQSQIQADSDREVEQAMQARMNSLENQQKSLQDQVTQTNSAIRLANTLNTSTSKGYTLTEKLNARFSDHSEAIASKTSHDFKKGGPFGTLAMNKEDPSSDPWAEASSSNKEGFARAAVNEWNRDVGSRLNDNCEKFRSFVSENKEVMQALVAKNAFGNRTDVFAKAVDDASSSDSTNAQFSVKDFERLQTHLRGNPGFGEHEIRTLADGAVPWAVRQALDYHVQDLSNQLNNVSGELNKLKAS